MDDKKPDAPKQDEGGIVVADSKVSPEPIQSQATAIPPTGSEGSITWTASEFIAHNKGPLWYVVLAVGSVVIAFLFWLLTKDVITSSAFVVVAIVLAIFGAKKPRSLEYRIDKDGLHIGGQLHSFNSFRSFAVMRQGAFSSLVFLPLRRFSLSLSAYYDPEDEQKIISIISAYLPMEEHKQDMLDSLMWRIRF